MDDALITNIAAAEAPPTELRLALRTPVAFADDTVDSITLREPKVHEWLTFSTAYEGFHADVAAVATVAALPVAVVSRFGARDLWEAIDYLNKWFGEIALADIGGADLPDSLTITLTEPLNISKEATTVAELHLREPLAAELIEWSKIDGLAGDIALLGAVTKVSAPLVRQMGVRDFRRAIGYLKRFFGPSPSRAAAS